MLLTKIEALRKEPRSVRNRYAFIIALSSTLVIALIWGISLPSRFGEVTSDASSDDDSPTSELANQFYELKGLIGDSVDTIKTQAELIGAASSSPDQPSNDAAGTNTQQQNFITTKATTSYATSSQATSSAIDLSI